MSAAIVVDALPAGARYVAPRGDKWPITGRNGTNGKQSRRSSPARAANKTTDAFMFSDVPTRPEPSRAMRSDAGSVLCSSAFITRMNPDLAMDTADQKLLKSSGAGNLFMVFGEPDLELRTLPDGKLQVELRGLDVYDPTTGEIRSNTTDEIACWFIDTDYNEESFFVRHAYFTGGDEPYKKLQRALKAEIDEYAWSTLYKTVSRPFDAPSTGKIAVKVIDHQGGEVLKVYEAEGSPKCV